MKLILKALWFFCFGSEMQQEALIDPNVTHGWMKTFHLQVSDSKLLQKPVWSLEWRHQLEWNTATGPWSWRCYSFLDVISYKNKKWWKNILSLVLLRMDWTANVRLTSVLATRQPPIDCESLAVTESRAASSGNSGQQGRDYFPYVSHAEGGRGTTMRRIIVVQQSVESQTPQTVPLFLYSLMVWILTQVRYNRHKRCGCNSCRPCVAPAESRKREKNISDSISTNGHKVIQENHKSKLRHLARDAFIQVEAGKFL